ncbi:MAG: rRNA methyltransferase [Anaeromyxobacteraceae bacterium]|nr:rRNA methyltransferase [Anaeromyxobacteraceae bacterium]
MTTTTPREDGRKGGPEIEPAPVRIVLVRPRNPENLGAVARAMRNFGLDDWAIAALGTHDFAAARRVAVHAEDLLDRPRLAASLDEAVADCAWVVGTSARKVRGKRRLLPEEVAREAAARAPGRTAIVFGEERSGLSGEELDRCHDLSAIPVDAAQPSLNLAQAVLVYAYEARRAGGVAPRGREGALATDAELERLEGVLRGLLRAGRFLAGPERHAVRDLTDVLRRGRPSPREARLWEAALRAVSKRLPDGEGEGTSRGPRP